MTRDAKTCVTCIYDSETAGITLDETGKCNVCKTVEDLKTQYQTGTQLGEEQFQKLISEIKRKGKKHRYDCIIGVSGGTDSSFLLHQAVREWKLRPLAVHYDNTWNSAKASQNIAKLVNKLDVDLYTYVVDNTEIDSLVLAFLKAGVAELEAPTDLAIAQIMNKAAWEHDIAFVLEGHSFICEGVTPLNHNYFDGRYIKDINAKFGDSKIKSYPLMDLKNFLFWTFIGKIKKIRPFWYLDYDKTSARQFLQKEYGWEYYGGHHLENRLSAYFHSIFMPKRFKTDFRNISISADVRSRRLEKKAGIEKYRNSPEVDPFLEEYFRKRLRLSTNQYISLLEAPKRSSKDFKTYKKCFELMKPLFYIAMKNKLVTDSFYSKYCKNK